MRRGLTDAERENITLKIAELQKEHSVLNQKIDAVSLKMGEYNQEGGAHVESLEIVRAKKQKLRLLDQIAYLKSLLIPDIIA